MHIRKHNKKSLLLFQVCLVLAVLLTGWTGAAAAEAFAFSVRVDHCVPGNEYLLVLLKDGTDAGSFTDEDILYINQLKADQSTVSAMVICPADGEVTAIAGGVFSDGAASPRKLTSARTARIHSETVEEEAFAGTAFSHVCLADGMVSIGARAFADMPLLTYIYIPASVTRIAEDAFSGSPGTVICSPADSAARQFAETRGIPWQPAQ